MDDALDLLDLPPGLVDAESYRGMLGALELRSRRAEAPHALGALLRLAEAFALHPHLEAVRLERGRYASDKGAPRPSLSFATGAPRAEPSNGKEPFAAIHMAMQELAARAPTLVSDMPALALLSRGDSLSESARKLGWEPLASQIDARDIAAGLGAAAKKSAGPKRAL